MYIQVNLQITNVVYFHGKGLFTQFNLNKGENSRLMEAMKPSTHTN